MTTAVQTFSVEAEQSLLAALMIDGGVLDVLEVGLRAEHFYVDAYRRVFAAISSLHGAGKGTDPITVSDELERTADLDILGGMAAVIELSLAAASTAQAQMHARIIVQKATIRALQAAGDEIVALATRNGETVEQKIDAAQSVVMSLSDSAPRRFEPVSMRDAVAGHIARIEARQAGEAEGAALSTGLPDLDKRLVGGFKPGQLIILAARPAMGKTSLAMGIALHAAQTGTPALFCSQEMPQEDLMDRLVSLRARVPLERIISQGAMNADDWTDVSSAALALRDMPLMIDEQPALNLMAVRSKARKAVREFGRVGLIVVDYLQLMVHEQSNAQNRNSEIEAISRGLKVLAKELSCPVVALAQLNRKCEERLNRRPMLADLRDSGAIEQDADVIMFLYRDEVYSEDSPYKGLAELGLGKVRQGKSGGFVPLVFRGEYTRFDSMFGAWPIVQEQQGGRRKRARLNDED